MRFSSVLFFSVLLFAASPVAANPRQRIVVSTALTGDAATYGTDMRNAFMFANEKLGGNRYELIFEDDRCNPRDAVTVAHRVINVLQVPYVMGFACSGAVLSTAALYEKAKVLVLSSAASAPSISSLGDYVFRTWPSDASAGRLLFEYAQPRHKIFGILSEQTDYAQGLASAFIQADAQKRLRIVQENYIPGTTDFRSLLLRLQRSGVQGLFIDSQTEIGFVTILRQVKEMQWDVALYGAFWPGTAAVLDKVGNQADGIVFPDMPSPADVLDEEGRRLYDEYLQRFGKPSSIELLFATSYEAFRALTLAIESAEDAPAFLYRTNFHGLYGDWHFDSNGDVVGLEFVMKRIVNGKPLKLP